MKITVAEFKAFSEAVLKDWNDNWYLDGPELDHGEDLDPIADYDDHELIKNKPDGEVINFLGQDILLNNEKGAKAPYRTTLAWFKAWKKAQTHEIVGVSVPKEKMEAFLAACASLGATLTAKPSSGSKG